MCTPTGYDCIFINNGRFIIWNRLVHLFGRLLHNYVLNIDIIIKTKHYYIATLGWRKPRTWIFTEFPPSFHLYGNRAVSFNYIGEVQQHIRSNETNNFSSDNIQLRLLAISNNIMLAIIISIRLLATIEIPCRGGHDLGHACLQNYIHVGFECTPHEFNRIHEVQRRCQPQYFYIRKLFLNFFQ